MFTDTELENGLAEAGLTEAEVLEMARDFIDECLAALETADVIDLSQGYDGGEGYAYSQFMGSVLYINPSGKYSHILSGVYAEDYLFWEEVERLADEHEMYITSGEGDALDIFVGKWIADTWNELTPEQQQRFVDYS